MPGTPPRYRYQKKSDDDDDSGGEDKNGVLAARSQQTQRPNVNLNGIELNRQRDRKRHGCDDPRYQEAPQNHFYGAAVGLQAPPLLQLGSLAQPLLSDPLNRGGYGFPPQLPPPLAMMNHIGEGQQGGALGSFGSSAGLAMGVHPGASLGPAAIGLLQQVGVQVHGIGAVGGMSGVPPGCSVPSFSAPPRSMSAGPAIERMQWYEASCSAQGPGPFGLNAAAACAVPTPQVIHRRAATPGPRTQPPSPAHLGRNQGMGGGVVGTPPVPPIGHWSMDACALSGSASAQFSDRLCRSSNPFPQAPRVPVSPALATRPLTQRHGTPDKAPQQQLAHQQSLPQTPRPAPHRSPSQMSRRPCSPIMLSRSPGGSNQPNLFGITRSISHNVGTPVRTPNLPRRLTSTEPISVGASSNATAKALTQMTWDHSDSAQTGPGGALAQAIAAATSPAVEGFSSALASTCRRRVLITGSSGLLGRQVLRALLGENVGSSTSSSSWEVRGLCRTRARPPHEINCDLSVDGTPSAQIEEFRPHVVVHLAAEWRPDVLRRRPTKARQLNVDVTGAVAAACERCGAWLIYVSADCVFDGKTPPYTEDATTNPLSEYGWQKLHGEQLVLAASPRAAVLRVPLLYGPFESISDSAVTSLYEDLKNGVTEVDAWQRCYPTWACDVAGVIREMMESHCSGESVRGVFHWQGSEQFTWHDMMLMVAEISGMDASGVTAVRTTPSVPLPRDTRLDCSRLQELLGANAAKFRTPLRQGLQVCLAPIWGGTSETVSCAATSVTPAQSARIAISKLGVVGGTAGFATSTGRRSVEEDPEDQFREELKARGTALQELFWQELERTRNRLRDAGFVHGSKGRPDSRAFQELHKNTPTLPCRSPVATASSDNRSEPVEVGDSPRGNRWSHRQGAPGKLHFPREQRV